MEFRYMTESDLFLFLFLNNAFFPLCIYLNTHKYFEIPPLNAKIRKDFFYFKNIANNKIIFW